MTQEMIDSKTRLGSGSCSGSCEGPVSISDRRSKIMACLVVGVITLPMLIAYLIFKTGVGMPTTTVNKGELIVPATSLGELPLENQSRQRVDWLQTSVEGDQKWRLLIVNDGKCGEACQSQLYKARQVHKRLAQKAGRVERLFLTTSPNLSPEIQTLLSNEYPLMAVGVIEKHIWQSQFASSSLPNVINSEKIIVVDQQGYAMMNYGVEHTGGEMLDDIKRLLKYSYEG